MDNTSHSAEVMVRSGTGDSVKIAKIKVKDYYKTTHTIFLDRKGQVYVHVFKLRVQ